MLRSLVGSEMCIRDRLKERAEDGAIETFGKNLRNLLLVAPLKGKVVLGLSLIHI